MYNHFRWSHGKINLIIFDLLYVDKFGKGLGLHHFLNFVQDFKIKKPQKSTSWNFPWYIFKSKGGGGHVPKSNGCEESKETKEKERGI